MCLIKVWDKLCGWTQSIYFLYKRLISVNCCHLSHTIPLINEQTVTYRNTHYSSNKLSQCAVKNCFPSGRNTGPDKERYSTWFIIRYIINQLYYGFYSYRVLRSLQHERRRQEKGLLRQAQRHGSRTRLPLNPQQLQCLPGANNAYGDEINANGTQILELMEDSLLTSNTLFEKGRGKIWTWLSPHKTMHPIDFILTLSGVRMKCRNSIVNSQTVLTLQQLCCCNKSQAQSEKQEEGDHQEG